MKIEEILIETKIIKIEAPGSNRPDYIVYQNPSPQDTEQLLIKYGELRGSVDVSGNIFIWAAEEATHGDANFELNKIDWDFDFVFSDGSEIDDGDWADLTKIGNYFFSDEFAANVFRDADIEHVKNRFLIRIFNYLKKIN